MAEYESTLCWGCKNTHKDKCSWFNPDNPQPVPGWVAELRPRYLVGESYMVRECPNFDPEPPRVPAYNGTAIPGVQRKGESWVATIYRNKKTHYLGSFATYKEAAAARRAAEEAIARGEELTARRSVGRPNTCGGVYFHGGRWEAYIPYKGRRRYLGGFATKEEATAARKAAEEAIARGETPCKQ